MPSVLLVEDDPDLAELLAELFVQVGWEVQSESNGHDALRAMKASRPDVIVTDGMMPQMGGRELLERVRHTPELADIPVVLMSGADAMLEGAATPKQVMLRKPFDPETLVEMVRKLLPSPSRG
jgi:CheY-like chemotaxis protein